MIFNVFAYLLLLFSFASCSHSSLISRFVNYIKIENVSIYNLALNRVFADLGVLFIDSSFHFVKRVMPSETLNSLEFLFNDKELSVDAVIFRILKENFFMYFFGVIRDRIYKKKDMSLKYNNGSLFKLG